MREFEQRMIAQQKKHEIMFQKTFTFNEVLPPKGRDLKSIQATPTPIKRTMDNTTPRTYKDRSVERSKSRKELMKMNDWVKYPKDCMPPWSPEFIRSSHRDLRRPGSMEKKLDTNYSRFLTPERNKTPIAANRAALQNTDWYILKSGQ